MRDAVWFLTDFIACGAIFVNGSGNLYRGPSIDASFCKAVSEKKIFRN
jgi:hypothetical protein